MAEQVNYPTQEEIAEVAGAAQDLRQQASDWEAEAAVVDDQFIQNVIDVRDPSPDEIPNGEERAQIRNEILPDLRSALQIVDQVANGKDGKNGAEKLEPARAVELLDKAQTIIDQAESDIDGLGNVRQLSSDDDHHYQEDEDQDHDDDTEEDTLQPR